MTKEELKKEAKGYVKTIAFVYETEVVRKIVCMYAEQAYLASAEPREKRIAELEKELAITDHDREHNYYECLDLYKKVAELEKENAELKADNDARKFAMAMSEKVEKQLREENAELKLKLEALDGQTPWKDIKDKSEVIGKLTNAKELLKNILAISVHDKRQCTYDAYILTVKEAEQFLKDSEVEK